MPETSTKPYLIRAIYEWCTDNGFTPYIAVFVDANTSVPREFVKNNEIVLNVSFDATSGLDMGNEWIGFSARFGGISRKIDVTDLEIHALFEQDEAATLGERAGGARIQHHHGWIPLMRGRLTGSVFWQNRYRESKLEILDAHLSAFDTHKRLP